MNKKFVIVLIGVMLLGTACNKNVEQEVQTNTTSQVESTIDVFGQVKAIDKKEVYINFPAIIEKIHIEEGQTVTKGTPLLTINYDSYKRTIKETEQKLELTVAQLESSVKGTNGLNAVVDKLQGEKSLRNNYLANDSSHTLKALENNLELIKEQIVQEEKNYKTLQELYAQGGSSQDALDKSKLKIDGLKKDKIDIEKGIVEFKDNTALQVNELTSSIVSTREDMSEIQKVNTLLEKQKQLNSTITEIQLNDMKEKLNEAYIEGNQVISKLDSAIIDEIKCEEGGYVGTNGPTYCVSLLDANSIQVVADVPEEFISSIKMGQECNITPYYDKGLVIKGKVNRISNVAIKKDGEVIIQVYVDILDKDNLILPGLSVDVAFIK